MRDFSRFVSDKVFPKILEYLLQVIENHHNPRLDGKQRFLSIRLISCIELSSKHNKLISTIMQSTGTGLVKFAFEYLDQFLICIGRKDGFLQRIHLINTFIPTYTWG